MVVQFRKPQPTFGEILFGGLGSGIGEGLTKRAEAGQELEIQEDERKRKAQAYKQVIESKEYQDLPMDQKIGLMSILNPEVVKAQQKQQELSSRQPLGGLGGQPVPQQYASDINTVINENPNATPEQLEILFNNAGIPQSYTKSIVESRRREGERKTTQESKVEERREKEKQPFRQKIIEDANAARDATENKQQLLNLIDTKNLNDPSFAAVMTALPFKLGERFLSPETVEYRAGLIDEYKDLKTIFVGQTRTAELDILGKKVADIYLTDEQKKAILKSRMRALEAPLAREEAVIEVDREKPNLDAAQWNQEVRKVEKQKRQSILNRFLDEQNFIIGQSEKRRKSGVPLNPDDPEDTQIMKQILKESNGNLKEAEKRANKLGYKFLIK